MEQAAVGEGGGSEKIFRDTYHHTRLLLIEKEDDEGVGNQCKGMHLEGKVINYTYCTVHTVRHTSIRIDSVLYVL